MTSSVTFAAEVEQEGAIRAKRAETDSPLTERRDLTISLTGKGMTPAAVAASVDPLIREQLQRQTLEGWEVDGSTDVFTLWRSGNLRCRENSSFWLDNRTYSPVSVTLRLRRASTAKSERNCQ
jgi:hypothetical protein